MARSRRRARRGAARRRLLCRPSAAPVPPPCRPIALPLPPYCTPSAAPLQPLCARRCTHRRIITALSLQAARRTAEQAAAAAAAAATRELAEAEAEAAALRAELHKQRAELDELRCAVAPLAAKAAPRAPRPYVTVDGGGVAVPAMEAVEARCAAEAEAEAEAGGQAAARLTAALTAAGREREVLRAQLQSLQRLQTTTLQREGNGESAGGALVGGAGAATGSGLETTLSAAAAEVALPSSPTSTPPRPCLDPTQRLIASQPDPKLLLARWAG